VFVGQSGVGKSSLVNSLLPEVETRVGPLSELSGQGTHTTTTAPVPLPRRRRVDRLPGYP
jgi:ribosome biogenesis GTPase